MSKTAYIFLIAGAILACDTTKVLAQSIPSCGLTDSIYQDVGEKGFEVRISPASSSNYKARLTVIHKSRGTLFDFNVIQQQGYGGIYLADRNKDERGNRINFFDANLSSASIFRADVAPPYFVISKLGSRDHYENDIEGAQGRTNNVGDPMWKLKLCASKSTVASPSSNGEDQVSTSPSRQPIEPPKPVTSRPPNGEEIVLLDRKVRNQQPKPPELNRFQRQDRKALQANTSNFIKPFAGGWMSADNQKYYVYPSTRPGKERQSCIIIENGSTQDLQIGVASGNAVGTDMNIGTARMFRTEDSKIVALRTPGNDGLVPLYASAISADITPGNLEMMQQNGCMTSFPGMGNSTIATKPAESSSPKQSSENVCPVGMFAATVPPRKEYDHQSPSYSFIETAGRFKDGTGTTPNITNISEKGPRKIRPDLRCNYLQDIDNPISPKRIWLVIHGWDNNVDDDSSATPKVVKALKIKYPNDRVLALDWSEAASNQGAFGSKVRGVYYAATWIRPVAEATVQQLREKYGIDDLSAVNNLNIIGHSLGSIMSAEIGSLYSSGVRSITALDPASEIILKRDILSELGGYDVDGRTPAYKEASLLRKGLSMISSGLISGRDLVRGNIDRPKCFGTSNNSAIQSSGCDSSRPVAQFSRAFVGKSSISGNQGLAASADESYQIDFGAGSKKPRDVVDALIKSFEEHGDVVTVFTNMISNNKFGGLLGVDDLNLHPEIIRGGDGHSGIIKVENLAAKELVLKHQVKNALTIEQDGKVYAGQRPTTISDQKLLVELGTVETIFNINTK